MVHITTGRLLGCLIILGSIFLLSAGLVEGEPHAPRGLLRPAFQRPPIPWRVVGAGATCPQLGGGARGPTEMKEPRRVGASLWMQEAGTSPGAAAADGASGEGPSRKQRRRLNRKTRNNSRNRIASDESGESSIRRNTELSQHFLTDKIIIERLVAEAKEKKRRQLNAASSPQHSASSQEVPASSRVTSKTDWLVVRSVRRSVVRRAPEGSSRRRRSRQAAAVVGVSRRRMSGLTA